MTIEYTMFGYDDDYNPTVATNVTAEQVRQIATEKDLNGMLLAPQLPDAPDNGGHKTYMRASKGVYEPVRMHVWMTANLTECKGEEVLRDDAQAQRQLREAWGLFLARSAVLDSNLLASTLRLLIMKCCYPKVSATQGRHIYPAISSCF